MVNEGSGINVDMYSVRGLTKEDRDKEERERHPKEGGGQVQEPVGGPWEQPQGEQQHQKLSSTAGVQLRRERKNNTAARVYVVWSHRQGVV